jgi:hypothetical protein
MRLLRAVSFCSSLTFSSQAPAATAPQTGNQNQIEKNESTEKQSIAIPAGTYLESVLGNKVRHRSPADRTALLMRFAQLLFANGYTVPLDSGMTKACAGKPNENVAVASARDYAGWGAGCGGAGEWVVSVDHLLHEMMGWLTGGKLRVHRVTGMGEVHLRVMLALLAVLCVGLPAKAQSMISEQSEMLGRQALFARMNSVTGEEAADVNKLIDSKKNQNSLPCHIIVAQPTLDFNLRFLAGFIFTTSFNEFGVGDDLLTLVRVTPDNGLPVLFARSFKIPTLPRGVVGTGTMTTTFSIGGGFVLGEGRYKVELLLLDKRERSHYRQWNLKTKTIRASDTRQTTPPLTVAAIEAQNWDGKLDPKGLRLTVLLDATPPTEYAATLRNRILLEQILNSLLEQVPCQSVKIVAFNLDQQAEIFRREKLDPAGLTELATSLDNLQLGVIPFQALERGSWLEFLLRIIREQNPTVNPSEAVVFLGSSTHLFQKPSKELQDSSAIKNAHFYYFEYYGFLDGRYPDAIEHVTRSLHGTVYRVDSPGQFGEAVQRMLAELKVAPNGESTH